MKSKDSPVMEFIKRGIERSSLNVSPREWLRKTAIISLVITGLIFFALVFYTEILSAITWSLGALVLIVSYLFFNLKYSSFKKANEIENILPEALEIISSGIKSGLSVKDSVQSIIRDEFEPLATEISKAFVQQSTGSTLSESLRNAAERVDSDLFKKTMATLTRSIDSGANVAEVSESLAKNINEVRALRKDIRSSTVTYTLFLSFASLIAAPILFALSSFLVETNAQIAKRTGAATGAGDIPSSFLQLTTQLPPVDVLNNFFIVILSITSISAAIAIGIVNKGHYKEGIKIIPIFLIVSLLIFFFASNTVSAFFGI